jgi:methylated-DNA-[protein]-cysteine S-methyltransferase
MTAVDRSAEYSCVYESPVGQMRLRADACCITGIDWLMDDATADKHDRMDPSDLLRALISTLDGYFLSGEMDVAALPLRVEGTGFQRKVLKTLSTIEFGCTRTYGDIATELATSARAVGGACATNHIPILIPCHRVVAANGIGGFINGFRHLDIKRWLLRHEGVI